MEWTFADTTAFFAEVENGRLLLDGLWGIEREGQRVSAKGDVALTPHPAVFGDKIENPHITTDFAESQLELVTDPWPSVEEAYSDLQNLQRYVESNLGDELVWPLSMPPRLPADELIPLARFNESEEGRRRELYRKGLSLRYGKKMQMISGIHFNFSFGAKLMGSLYDRFGRSMDTRSFSDEIYFHTARNYLRNMWLLAYLFGASPGHDASYESALTRDIDAIIRCCEPCCSIREDYPRYATSLRVSRYGYASGVQGRFPVSFNSLGSYIEGVRSLLAMKSSDFEKLGPEQLNANFLQKDSELYSQIRFKQSLPKGMSQLDALEQWGVGYLEVRILDLNPCSETGITLDQLRFMQVFMLYCLMEESPPFSDGDYGRANDNLHVTAFSGRKPDVMLDGPRGRRAGIPILAREILGKLETIAGLIDRNTGKQNQVKAVEAEYSKIRDTNKLPSQIITNEMARTGDDFITFGIRHAKANREALS